MPPTWSHTDTGEVAAVGSRSQAGLTSSATGTASPAGTPSYEALVADPDVDVIYVATPHSFHHENALLALEAGKHVLVEKAFTMNAARGDRTCRRRPRAAACF